jgi:uncharacterized membrane protein SirB2
MIAAPEALVHLAQPWADFYSNSAPTRTVVVFLHIAPLVVGGGVAIATDRLTIRALRLGGDARARHLDEMAGVHRIVVPSLVLTLLTGALLFVADLDTFFSSPWFWVKMALVAMLLVNGLLMTQAETALRTVAETTPRLSRPSGIELGEGGVATLVEPVAATTNGTLESAWRRLHGTSIASVTLWLLVTFLGVVLVNAG